MPPRLFIDEPIASPRTFALPERAARHVQVLRLQPGDAVTLFDGSGGEWSAQVAAMEKRGAQVDVLEHSMRECELPVAVTLAVGVPTNDRMDALVEKATELGVTAIVPLLTERSVLRLSTERAERRQAHWRAIAIAACEQCGRNRVPAVHAVLALPEWLAGLRKASGEARLLLGWRDALPWREAAAQIDAALIVLSGPEGGLTEAEEDLARTRGFAPATLGSRVLRADTAPMAALATIALWALPRA